MSDEFIPEDPWAADYSDIASETGGEGPVDVPLLPPAPAITLGELLSHYREVSRVTQDQVWRATGIDQSNLSKYEGGRVKPNPKQLGRLADLYSQHIEGQSKARIMEHFLAARDQKRVEPLPLPELMRISDKTRAFPAWYQKFILRSLTAQFDILVELWDAFRKHF